MVGWHPQLNEHEFVQTPGDGEGQGCLGVLPSTRSQSGAQLNDWVATDQPYLRPCVPHPPHFLLSLYVRILRFLPHGPDTGSPLASPADRLAAPPRRPPPGGSPASRGVHSPVLRISSRPLLGAHCQEEARRATIAALTSTAAEVFQAPSLFSCSSRRSFTSRTTAE